MPDASTAEGRPGDRTRTSRAFGQYIIKHAFQFKFSLGLLVILAVATFVLWLESNLAIRSIIRSGAVADPGVIEQLRLLNSVIAKSGIVITALSFLFALYMTHYIAGPLYRFEKTFEELKGGNLNLQIRLRKRDEFQDVARAFNEGLVSVRQQLRREREATDAAAARVAAVSDSLRAAGHSAAAAQLDDLLTALRATPGQLKL